MNIDIDKTTISNESDKTQISSAPVFEATQQMQQIDCPICNTKNPFNEKYCIECGFLLSSEVGEVISSEIAFKAKLISTDGSTEYFINDGDNKVGRERAEILLSHNTVSRNHAIISLIGNEVFVEDLASTNGTQVNGVRINANTKTKLEDGAEIVFGNVAFKVSINTAEPKLTEEFDEEDMSDNEETKINEIDKPEEPEIEEDQPIYKLTSSDGSMIFELKKGSFSLGRRSGDNDLVVSDPYCSGKHAKIEVSDENITITDLASTNGTQVNGVKLEANTAKTVMAGDEIIFGQTTFRLEKI
ncbi:MAG: FHA domain-containing protein [Armatimonadota bacterium]